MHESRRATRLRDPSPAPDEPSTRPRVSVARRAVSRRLNLAAIESSLRAVQRAFPEINARLQATREPLSDEVLTNLMAGYALIDAAIKDAVDLFAPGNLRHLLELNRLVLCGPEPRRRRDYAAQIRATEAHFYAHTGGSIGSIVEWQAGYRHRSAWRRAAGVYVRILSEPQLYLEGNHRCGALIMSYLLAREGKPPFVLTVGNAKAYFDPSTLVTGTRKTSFALLFKLPQLVRGFARFLEAEAHDWYLL